MGSKVERVGEGLDEEAHDKQVINTKFGPIAITSEANEIDTESFASLLAQLFIAVERRGGG